MITGRNPRPNLGYHLREVAIGPPGRSRRAFGVLSADR